MGTSQEVNVGLYSVCCGAPQFSEVAGMCAQCRDWTGFEWSCDNCSEPIDPKVLLDEEGELCDNCYDSTVRV